MRRCAEAGKTQSAPPRRQCFQEPEPMWPCRLRRGQEPPVCGHLNLADAPVVGAGDSPASCSPNSRQICCAHTGLLAGVLRTVRCRPRPANLQANRGGREGTQGRRAQKGEGGLPSAGATDRVPSVASSAGLAPSGSLTRVPRMKGCWVRNTVRAQVPRAGVPSRSPSGPQAPGPPSFCPQQALTDVH